MIQSLSSGQQYSFNCDLMLDIIIDLYQYTHSVVFDVLTYTLWREILAWENIGKLGE